MSAEKTETRNLRACSSSLRDAAAAEHRSQTNLLEKLVQDHCASSQAALGGAGGPGASASPNTISNRSA